LNDPVGSAARNPVKTPVQIAIVVLCLGGAGYFLISYLNTPSPTSEEGVPEYLHYKCGAADCLHEYTWKVGTDTGDRDIDTCPECGTLEMYRSAKCQECGLFQPLAGHGTFEKICPGCGADVPPLRDQK
jgi:hypothetical protein